MQFNSMACGTEQVFHFLLSDLEIASLGQRKTFKCNFLYL